MTLNRHAQRAALNASLLALLILSLFFHPQPVTAAGTSGTANLPALTDFSLMVKNGESKILRGVYVDNVLALPVVQQPSSNAGYVSNKEGEVTQFALASKFGNIGLLAHNYLAGKTFSQLAVGQKVRLVYGDGKIETYIVAEVLHYQALQPSSPYSDFRSLDQRTTLTPEKMFKRVYFGDRHITFQTCIEKNGNVSWGRLFVIAIPRLEYEKMESEEME